MPPLFSQWGNLLEEPVNSPLLHQLGRVLVPELARTIYGRKLS